MNAVTGAIVGACWPDQVRGIIGAMALRLSNSELTGIESFLATEGLLERELNA